MNAIEEALKRLERGVLSAVKETMQRAPQELSIYVAEYRQDPSKKDGLERREKYRQTGNNLARKKKDRVKNKTAGDFYYTKPNTTSRLRNLYGNVQRATLPKGKGNISDVELNGGKVLMTFGYNSDQVVTAGTRSVTLEYAKINEKKRPFLVPGFKSFMSDAQGYKALMSELETAIVELANA